MKFTGYITLNSPLTVKSDCLNKTFQLGINSVYGIIMTPRLSKESMSQETGQILEEPGNEHFFNDKILWGKVIQSSDCKSHIYNFKIEFDNIDEEEKREVGERLYQELPNWIIRLKENLAVFGQNLDLPLVTQDKTESKKANFDLFYTSFNKSERPFTQISTISMILGGHSGINCEDLSTCLELTSKNKRPLLEFLLLSDANISLLEGNFRKSILDCATACELAFTNCLRREIKVEQPLLDEILKMHNSLAKKRRLLKVIGINLPDYNYDGDLDTLRNRAIHIGKEPTGEEARNAFRISKDVVTLLTKEKFE